MFDRQIFIVDVFFFHHFYHVNIQYHLYFVPLKIFLSQIIDKFRALCRHDVVVKKNSNSRNTIYNDPQIYKTNFVFGKKSILNFAHFLPGPPIHIA